MMSVITNTNGHNSTPAVNDSDPVCPNRFQFSGSTPSVPSSAKILTPMNSAISALATKNPDRIRNSRVAREAKAEWGTTDMPRL